MRGLLVALFALGMACLHARGSEKAEIVRLKPPQGMDRAELACIRLVPKPVGVLVLCPGYNQNADQMIGQEVWQDYARKNHLGLVGLSFSSPEKLLADRGGYYVVEDGSGECLLKGIEQGFGEKNLPIFLYGFSGGAHFAGNVAEWKPERVKGWCAYSAAWWQKPIGKRGDGKKFPPGIVGCGQLDRYRLGASLLFFKQGRALGRPWLWVELKGEDHAWPRDMDSFVRDYFSALLQVPEKSGVHIDVENREVLSPGQSVPKGQETLYGWLPDAALAESWKKLHQP